MFNSENVIFNSQNVNMPRITPNDTMCKIINDYVEYFYVAKYKMD